MPNKGKIQFCKGEQCFSCHNKTDSEAVLDPDTGEEETIIYCALELSKGAEELEQNEDNTVKCPSYVPDATAEEERPEDESASEPADREKYDDEDIEETRRMYTFRGNSLVEVAHKTEGQTCYNLPPSFVEYYNLRVANQTQTIQREVERLQGQLVTMLTDAKGAVESAGDGVTEEDIAAILFMDDDEAEDDDFEDEEYEEELVDEGDDDEEDDDEDLLDDDDFLEEDEEADDDDQAATGQTW